MIISESKSENYCTEISDNNAVIFSDTSKNNGGSGRYLGPHELLCAGLASCLNITTRMVLDHKNLKYDKVIVKVDLDGSDESKTKFIYDIDIIGDIPEETKQHIKKIVGKCPVKKTLSKEIIFETPLE